MASRCAVASLMAGVCWVAVLGAAAPGHGATFIYLNSDPGDDVGGGRQYLETSADGTFTVEPFGNAVTVYFVSNDLAHGGDRWTGILGVPFGGVPLALGTYEVTGSIGLASPLLSF